MLCFLQGGEEQDGNDEALPDPARAGASQYGGRRKTYQQLQGWNIECLSVLGCKVEIFPHSLFGGVPKSVGEVISWPIHVFFGLDLEFQEFKPYYYASPKHPLLRAMLQIWGTKEESECLRIFEGRGWLQRCLAFLKLWIYLNFFVNSYIYMFTIIWIPIVYLPFNFIEFLFASTLGKYLYNNFVGRTSVVGGGERKEAARTWTNWGRH